MFSINITFALRKPMEKFNHLQEIKFTKEDFIQVLPPLCAELRNMVMQPMILPMVLTIAESQVLLMQPMLLLLVLIKLF